MAGARQSKASHRREREARESVTHERVTLIALGVLVAVAIIVAIGVVWGLILPPRAHVLTVGNAEFNARAVADRAIFLTSGVGSNQPPADDPVSGAVDMLRRQEILLQVGAPQVGEITGDDLTAGIRKTLGVTPDVTAEAFQTQYRGFLEHVTIDQATFERIVRSEVVLDRLAKKFEADVGTTALQYHLQGIGSRDQNKAKQLRDAVAGGADFAAKAIELGLATPQQPADMGWVLPPTEGPIKDQVQLDKMQPGQMSEIIERNFQYELYRLVERDEKHPLTDEQKHALAEKKVEEWIKQQVNDRVKVVEDLSDGEKKWILKRVTDAAIRTAADRAKAQATAPKSVPIQVGK